MLPICIVRARCLRVRGTESRGADGKYRSPEEKFRLWKKRNRTKNVSDLPFNPPLTTFTLPRKMQNKSPESFPENLLSPYPMFRVLANPKKSAATHSSKYQVDVHKTRLRSKKNRISNKVPLKLFHRLRNGNRQRP